MITEEAQRRAKILIHWENMEYYQPQMPFLSPKERCLTGRNHLMKARGRLNTHCESFNGTIQEEFIDYNVNLFFDDITAFNKEMKEYLIFYNTKRVHWAFKNKETPFDVLVKSKYYVSKLLEKCNNRWTQSTLLKRKVEKALLTICRFSVRNIISEKVIRICKT